MNEAGEALIENDVDVTSVQAVEPGIVDADATTSETAYDSLSSNAKQACDDESGKPIGKNEKNEELSKEDLIGRSLLRK